jgi:DNA-binding transcriptional ArsR family regulator
MNHREIEKILKALGNRRRLAIVKCLKKVKEVNVGNMAYEIGLSLRSTSRHLAILEKADVLEKNQRGLEVFYRLTDKISRFVESIVREL